MVSGNAHSRGGEGSFPETSWTTIGQVRHADPDVAFAAVSRLAERYRPALGAFLLQIGCPAQELDDVVQDFLASRFLRESFLRNVDSGNGLFRTFLRTCLRRFLVSRHRREARRPLMESLEGAEGQAGAMVAADVDRTLDRLWAGQVIANARARLLAEVADAGRGVLYAALDGQLESDPEPGVIAEIAQRMGMTPNAVWVASHRFRERLKWFIQDEVRQTVREPADWRRELAHLVEALRE